MTSKDKSVQTPLDQNAGLKQSLGRHDVDQLAWLDKSIEEYKRNAMAEIKPTVILKPMAYSFVALIISFFLDVSRVPLLGAISVEMAKKMFPDWNPENLTNALSLWWLPVAFYAVFVIYAYMAFRALQREVRVSGSYENIDRILESYISAVKGISTAVPLIGAAILLVSVKLGPEVFIGISVPFEIKALLVLAIGELFCIVFDRMGVAFNDIINGIKDLRERFFVRVQMDNTNLLIKRMEDDLIRSSGGLSGIPPQEDLAALQKTAEAIAALSRTSLENYRAMIAAAQEIKTIPVNLQEMVNRLQFLTEQLQAISQATKVTLENFAALAAIPRELKNLPGLSDETVAKLKSATDSLKAISEGLSHPGTQAALKSLENIVAKK